MENIKIHLDTDLGGDIDDVCALAFLLRSPDVEITGITVVGDTGGRRTGYTKYVLMVEQRSNIQVAAGAETSRRSYRSELRLLEEGRYWPEPIRPSPNPPEEAVQLLRNSIEQGATVVGVGPYTNLYLLDKQHPGILKQANLVLMGGYVYPVRQGFPDWKNDFDFNVQVDVNSAKHVLQGSNPTLVPLSVTAETSLRRSHLAELRKAGALGELIALQAEAFAEDEWQETKYGRTCKRLPEDHINFQHDALACAIAVGYSDGIEMQALPLVVDEKDGWLHERIDNPGRPIKVVTRVDGPRFNEFWLERVRKGFASKQQNQL